MAADVSKYYNRNTRSFLRFGRGSGSTGTIHRALRGPGVTTQEEALHFIHRQLTEVVEETGVVGDSASQPVIADLGCGVGASMEWLSRRLPARFAGLTLSEVQAATGRERLIHNATSETNISVYRGDFSSPEDLQQLTGGLPALLDGAYMIESFNHGSDATTTLAAIAGVIRPGGVLAICDDIPREELLQSDEKETLSPRHRHWMAEFTAGWHVHTFLSTERLEQVAEKTGFHLERATDLSEYVVVDRPRDRMIRLVAGPAALLKLRTPWWQNIRGGNALQQLEKAGLMSYQLLVFRRGPAPRM